VEDVPSQGWLMIEHGDAGDLNMFGSDGRQNIIINNSKIYGNATGTPTWGERFGEHLLKSPKPSNRLNNMKLYFRQMYFRNT
jgi:hypothetical protein